MEKFPVIRDVLKRQIPQEYVRVKKVFPLDAVLEALRIAYPLEFPPMGCSIDVDYDPLKEWERVVLVVWEETKDGTKSIDS